MTETGGSGALIDTGCLSLQGGGVGFGDGVIVTGCTSGVEQDHRDPDPADAALVGSACGCRSAPGAGLGFWLVLVAVLRRLAPLVVLAVVIPGSAWAVDVDHLRPDGGTWAALREGDVGDSAETQAALVGGLLRAPAVLSNGQRSVDVLSVVTTGELAASVTLSRVRMGVLVPVHPLVVERGTPLTLIGDVGLGVGIGLSPRDRAAQWSFTMAMDLATGSPEHLLGDGGTVGAMVANDTPLGRRFRLGGQLGVTLRQPSDLPGSVWGRAVEYGAGLAWQPSAHQQVALEGFGSLGLESATAATLPAEVLLTDRIGLTHAIDLRFGGGGGVGVGLGNPKYRLLFELDTSGRVDRDQDHDHHPDLVDLCPRRAEDRDHWHDLEGCPDPDNDHDAILDPVDRCPNEAEVRNGWLDDDGCPDALAEVTITLAADVDSARVSVDGEALPALLGGEQTTIERLPGILTIEVTSDGYRPLRLLHSAPEGASAVKLDLALIPRGAVVVTVFDPDGQPVHAAVSADDDPAVDAPFGSVRIPRDGGPVDLEVTARGFEPARARAVVPADGEVAVTVRLARPAVAQVGQQLIVGDRIQFALDDHRVLGSEAALDALADWLRRHPEVRLVRIEGHADDLGTPAYNLGLSTRRAESVRDALVARGIAAARLQPLGSGESHRFSDTPSERLVDFLVLVWDEGVAERSPAP